MPGHAAFNSAGAVRRFDRPPQPDELVTTDDVQQPIKLARLLTRMLKQITELLRAWRPRRIDFEDVACPGNPGTVTLSHRFGKRVRWSVVEWNSNGSAWFLDASHYFVGPALSKNAATDINTLVLDSYFAGTATIRIEEAG